MASILRLMVVAALPPGAAAEAAGKDDAGGGGRAPKQLGEGADSIGAGENGGTHAVFLQAGGPNNFGFELGRPSHREHRRRG